KEYDAAIRAESNGRMGFRIYSGSVQGDEKDVLRKIRIGQLQAGGFTGVGMGEIAPKVRILDSPFLVRSYEEVDHLYREFDKEFQKAFEDGGYVLLGWAEVGFVHVFTRNLIQKPEDLRSLKIWTWEGDPVALAAFSTLNINPISLSITDVMTSLQTGLIDAFYTSPLAAIYLQWYTRVKYMIDAPLADAAGAVLISKRYFDQLPPDLQEILIRNGRKYMATLTRLSREENREAIGTLQKNGITVVPVQASDLPQYVEAGRRARRALAGRLYPEEFLNQVEKSLEDFRTSSSKSPQ
ncbi:MAG: TRAP transporter substrate-binding protein DctP, partial [Bacteroidota bacterium]